MSRSKLGGVLDALSEVIVAQCRDTAHTPTATEYFAAVFTTLKASSKLDHLNELLEVLCAVTPETHQSVVAGQFRGCSEIIAHILKNVEEQKTQSLCINILGFMMKKQEVSESLWKSVPMLKLLNLFLKHVDDSRNKLRKDVHQRLADILQYHKKVGLKASRAYISDFCTAVFQSCNRSNYKRALHVVSLLTITLSAFQENEVMSLCRMTLRLQECEQPVLTAATYRMFDSFFQSPDLSVPPRSLLELVRTLVAAPLATPDMEAISFYCTALASGLTALHRTDKVLFAQHCSQVLLPATSLLVARCESEFSEIHCAVGTALKRIISSFVEESAVVDAVQMADATSSESALSGSALGQFVSILTGILHLRHQHSWVFTLDAVRLLFSRIPGRSGAVLLSGFVGKLADIYHAVSTGVMEVSPGVDMCVKDTLGAAVRSLGVPQFLAIVPLRLSQQTSFDPLSDLDTSRDWLLAILHANLKLMPCRLQDFNDIVLNTAKIYNAALRASARSPDTCFLSEPQASILRTRVMQMWSLFPSFCASGAPSDVADRFPSLISVLDTAMKDPAYPDIMLHVVSGLTSIVNGVTGKYPSAALRTESEHTSLPADLAVLRKQGAPVFVPSLLSLLDSIDISDSVRFQPAVRCLAAWASVAAPALITNVAKKLLQLLLSSQSESSASASWMAVILALIPYLPDPMLTLLYRTIKPLLSVNESVSMQKRAYKVLHALLLSHSELLFKLESRQQILHVIADSLLTCHVSARHIRLLCIGSLITGMVDSGCGEEELRAACGAVLCETLICLKDANKKSRDGALDLMKVIYGVLPARDVLPHLFAGIVGETPTMRSAAIIGLCVLVHQHQQRQGEDEHNEEYIQLLESAASITGPVLLLLQEESVEQTRAVLSFIKVCVGVLPVSVLNSLLPDIMGAILGDGLGGADNRLKGKFSSRVRSIMRKVSQRIGVEVVRPLVPESDVALLNYIQKQSRRTQTRKDKKLYNERLERMMVGSDSEGESSDEEEEGKQRGKAAHVRPKATKATDFIAEGLPTSLDDLLEDQTTKAVVGSARTKGSREKESANGEAEDDGEGFTVKVTKEGRVVVVEKEVPRPSKSKGSESEMDVQEEKDLSVQALKEAASGKGSGTTKKRAREPGEEYRSQKSGGDVWKKGMLEPHAFFPLDAKLLTKKNEKAAVAHVGIAVQSANKRRRMHGGDSGLASRGKKVSTMVGRKQRIAMMKSKNK